MPILKAIVKNKKSNNYKQSPASFKMLLNYITRKGKDESEVYKSFGIGLSDNPEKAFKQTLFNWETHDTKDDIRLYKHYIKSYPVGYKDLETIEKITREFTEKNFLDRGFKCFVAIHQDKEHIHAHILTDCTNYLTGYKLQELSQLQLETRYKNKELRSHELTLDQLKDSMEEIALKYGLDSPKRSKEKEKNTSKNIGNMAKYKALEKDDSWRNKIASTWEEVILETTTTLENLKEKLEEKGISITRFSNDGRPLTLKTSYIDSKGIEKTGKSKLTTLEKEEDYRFNITPNLYNWDNVLNILDKHKSKEFEEEITADALEKAIGELEKELTKEKNFEKEFDDFKNEFITYEHNPNRIYEWMYNKNTVDFYKKMDTYIKEVESGKKDYTSISELHKIKDTSDFEKVLELNTNFINKENERKEKERIEREEKEKRLEEEKRIKKEKEEERRRLQAERRNDRYWNSKKNNNAVELNNSYYDDIKERLNNISEEKNITKDNEEIKKDEVQTPSKNKEKGREYGE